MRGERAWGRGCPEGAEWTIEVKRREGHVLLANDRLQVGVDLGSLVPRLPVASAGLFGRIGVGMLEEKKVEGTCWCIVPGCMCLMSGVCILMTGVFIMVWCMTGATGWGGMKVRARKAWAGAGNRPTPIIPPLTRSRTHGHCRAAVAHMKGNIVGSLPGRDRIGKESFAPPPHSSAGCSRDHAGVNPAPTRRKWSRRQSPSGPATRKGRHRAGTL